LIKTFQTGGNRNLGYLIADDATQKAIVIDPSYDPAIIATYASENGYTVTYVFNTHDHHDHTNGNDAFEASTGIRALKLGDVDPTTGQVVADGAVFPLGESSIKILHTPGHTPDSICLLIGDALFTGDTLFVGKVGGTDLDAGARTEYASLHEKLMTLPSKTHVYPGHDVGAQPQSTIHQERETNPFLLRADVESFIELKTNWAEYKKEHGIE
jgi:hydroxyacylglutathione hydrolase